MQRDRQTDKQRSDLQTDGHDKANGRFSAILLTRIEINTKIMCLGHPRDVDKQPDICLQHFPWLLCQQTS